jgi:hypothetical protein
MKWQVIILLAVMAGLTTVSAEDSPLPSPSPSADTGEVEEPALPMPEPGPSIPDPGLLPESGELPARPVPDVPSKLSPGGASPQAASENAGRLEEIRSLAMRSPRAVYLLKRARHSSNSASRHLYLRAYYIAVASQMRKLNPNLKSSIDAYEEAQIREISDAHTATARAAFHRSRSNLTASRERHHRSHRVSYAHRHRRYFIIDYPYGPPYGPEFPPYGPPMVFYPW